MFSITLVKVPGESRVVNLQAPTTINQALTDVGETPGNWKFLINGEEVDGETQLTSETGTLKLIKSKVKGNS